MLDPPQRLRNAVIAGNIAIVRRILSRFPELVDDADPITGMTLLHEAAHRGDYKTCVFLSKLANSSHRGFGYGNTGGNDKGEDEPSNKNSQVFCTNDGFTPLHLAALGNHEQTVHFLAQQYPQSLDRQTADGSTALLLAAKTGHNASVNLLLDFSADIDIPDNLGNRPIHYAAAFGHVKTIRTLVQRGADCETPNLAGWSPLQYSSTMQIMNFFAGLIAEAQAEKNKKRLQIEERARQKLLLQFDKSARQPGQEANSVKVKPNLSNLRVSTTLELDSCSPYESPRTPHASNSFELVPTGNPSKSSKNTPVAITQSGQPIALSNFATPDYPSESTDSSNHHHHHRHPSDHQVRKSSSRPNMNVRRKEAPNVGISSGASNSSSNGGRTSSTNLVNGALSLVPSKSTSQLRRISRSDLRESAFSGFRFGVNKRKIASGNV